jgi:hypothetical protein
LDQLREKKELLSVVVEEHQDRLKKEGDWVIYPITVQVIAEGRLALENGVVYLDGKPAQGGLCL